MDENRIPRGWKSVLFVALQFLSLGYIFLSGPLLAENPFLLAVELVGLGVGVWAVLAMGLGNFHIAPVPLTWSKMIRRGPYRLIRHPMYLALLLTTFPLLLADFSLSRLAVWLVLLLTLLFKMRFEEGLLADKFPDYRTYMLSTARLIPGLY